MSISSQNKIFCHPSRYLYDLYNCPVREGRGRSRDGARPNTARGLKDGLTALPGM